MSSVSLQRVVKRYGNVPAVNGIDLDVEEGEFIVLLGPSGCGKTTTLRCIAGLEDVSGGQITMGGKVVSSVDYSLPSEKRNIGMVFQSYAIWPHMTVFENVAFGLTLKSVAKGEIKRRVEQALDLVGLESFSERGVSRLSGGQQQRVALARAFVLEPQVLLFDEPLSNLDAKLRERMRFELRQLQKRLGTTSIYVTHDQQEAMVVADRIILMNEGRIEQIGSPVDIYRRPSSRFGAEFIGLANFMPGKIVAGGDRAKVVVDGDICLDSTQKGSRDGSVVDVMIRPENLRITTARPEGGNAFPARVTTIYYLGNMVDLYMASGPHQLRGQLCPPGDLAEGQQVWVQVPADDVVLLPHETAGNTMLQGAV